MSAEQGKQIIVYHLPVQLVQRLDAKWAELLARGGYGEWFLKIEHGQIRFFKSSISEDWMKLDGQQPSASR